MLGGIVARMTAPIVAKILGGVAAAAIAFGLVQTVRIEGAFCRDVKVGEKPACVVRGFKQEIATIRIDLDQVRAHRDLEVEKHKATKRTYAEAQREAERLEAERLARVEAQQKEITDDRFQSYERRLAGARADAARLRDRLRAGGAGAGGAAAGLAVPGFPAAAGEADGAPGGDGLSRALIATAQAIQLDELISWIEDQARIDNTASRATPGPTE